MLYSTQVYNRSILPRTPTIPKLREWLTTSRIPPPMLKIHNSLKREKQVFTPIEPGKVRMYVCGMTVYDSVSYTHLDVYKRQNMACSTACAWRQSSVELRTAALTPSWVRAST